MSRSATPAGRLSEPTESPTGRPRVTVGCIYQVKLPDAHACLPEAGHLVAGG
jgi:hypothetical protein